MTGSLRDGGVVLFTVPLFRSHKQASHAVIDEYEDIGYEEREFMKLWNTHIATFPPYGDTLWPATCERFVTRFAPTILANKLRYMALLHFLTMWDHGLLRGDEVAQYMGMIDRVQVGLPPVEHTGP